MIPHKRHVHRSKETCVMIHQKKHVHRSKEALPMCRSDKNHVEPQVQIKRDVYIDPKRPIYVQIKRELIEDQRSRTFASKKINPLILFILQKKHVHRSKKALPMCRSNKNYVLIKRALNMDQKRRYTQIQRGLRTCRSNGN